MKICCDLSLTRGDFTFAASFSWTGDALGFFGQSGAGKSTLLHILSGTLRPDRGCVELDEQMVCDCESGVWIPPQQRKVGVVYQHSRLFPHMSVKKNLFYARPESEGSSYSRDVIEALNLGPLCTRKPYHLSGGERQRVALGRALIYQPKLLLLDEPFSGIDQTMRHTLLPYLNKVRTDFNIPLVVISHDLHDILQLTDQLLLIEKGSVVAQGTCNDLAFNPKTERLIMKSGISSTFNARVERCAEGEGIMELSRGETTIRAAYTTPLTPGSLVLARIRPEDVTLAMGPADFITCKNQMPGMVLKMRDFGPAVLVEIDVGFPLLAEITSRAAQRCGLSVGSDVWCLFKAASVDVTSIQRHG